MGVSTLSSKGGEIVVFNNEIAFRLDFEIHLSGSLMFDRKGNYLPESEESNDQENPISENLDLDDINMTETLEEVSPQTPLEDGDDAKKEPDLIDTMEDEFEIGLPDYDLDEKLNLENENPNGNETDDFIQDELVDEDINDILQESRNFWEQKKNS